MMLKVFLLFILLIAGIVLGPMLAGHRGYVLIQTDNYNIETSVTGLVIILIPVWSFCWQWSGSCVVFSVPAYIRAAGSLAVSAVAPVSRPSRHC